MYNTILLSTGILRLSLMFCFLILNVSTKKKVLITMWIWLPCSYYSAWHDWWLVTHFPKALCRKISCLSRKTWMSIWGGCFFFFFLPSSASHIWVERRELHRFILLVFRRSTNSPHTLSLEAPHAISFYIIILFYFFFFSSSWLQPILTVRASGVRLQAVVCLLPQEWRQPVEGRWNRRRGPGKMEKKNPVWWGDD